jgi:hypothetical protein
MDQWRHLQREWGTSVQPLKKPTVPTVLTHHQFMDKNKQLTSLTNINAYLCVNGSENLMGHQTKKTIAMLIMT